MECILLRVLFFQSCNIEILVNFSQKIAQIVKFTLEKQNFSYIPILFYFVKKATKFVKNNSLYIDQTWQMENTKFGQLANYFS
jgi:hypothetical protein